MPDSQNLATFDAYRAVGVTKEDCPNGHDSRFQGPIGGHTCARCWQIEVEPTLPESLRESLAATIAAVCGVPRTG